MKVKFIRIIRSSDGKNVLGNDEKFSIEPHLLGGAVPGYLVTWPGGGRVEHIPSSNIERAQLELEPGEPAGLSVKPALEAAAKKAGR